MKKKPATTAQEVVKDEPPLSLVDKTRYAVILVVTAVAAFLGAQILGPIVISIFGIAVGVTGPKLASAINNNSYVHFFLFLLIEALTIWVVDRLLKNRKWSWSSIGIARRPTWKDGGIGLVMYGIYFLIFFAVQIVVEATHLVNSNQSQQLGFEHAHGPQLVLVFLSLVILPPIAEEVMFRGFIYLGLRRKLNILPAALLTSVLFSIAHLEFSSGQSLNWAAAIDTFTLSCVLVYVTEKTRSLWPGMLVHSLKNFVAFLFLFVIKTRS